jgi:WhiB family redox-sensing transcriptional regulator
MKNTSIDKPTSHIELPSLTNWGDDAWRKDAYCKGMETDLFFPQMSETLNIPLINAKARLICAGCKVRKECVSFALENHIKYGIFGGTTPMERRKMKVETATGLLPVTTVINDLRKIRKYKKDTSTKTLIPQLAKVLQISNDDARDLVRDSANKFV